MHREIKEYLTKNNYKINRITLKNNTIIIDNKFVIKKRNSKLEELYNYLKSRYFTNFPKIIYRTDNYDFFEYIDNVNIPREQKSMDIIKLLTSLHSKTSFYKDLDENYYKKIYEDNLNIINYLENYYNDIAEIIEKEEFPSPAQYLLIRNISKIFISINYAKINLNEWYKIINEKKSIRLVTLHNNIDLDHYLIKDKPYFISWSKSKKDMPIYDLINMYKKYYLEFDFITLLQNYELMYPLLLEEKRLLFSLISIPKKIDFNNSEYILCQNIRSLYDYLNTTNNLINDYFNKEKKKHK